MKQRASLDVDAAGAPRVPILTGRDADARRFAADTMARDDVAGLVPRDATRILDVGCSNGALGLALEARRERMHVTGIEIDDGLAQEAQRVLDRVVHADLEAIDLADALGIRGRRAPDRSG
jgi:16S rRNA A1518/A1519 N6-dimethyltransferase RsmA/KsgA/DIM1 with predicted DNA glycosylase/AP lyase activity